MKNINYLIIVTLTVLFSACSGSETYRGEWKATDSEGNHLDITFQEKSFSIKSQDGDSSNFSYTQNSVQTTNSVETYGINVGDGRSYQIHFPIANDESKGLMNDGNGNPMYIISRNDYIGYDDIYKLK